MSSRTKVAKASTALLNLLAQGKTLLNKDLPLNYEYAESLPYEKYLKRVQDHTAKIKKLCENICDKLSDINHVVLIHEYDRDLVSTVKENNRELMPAILKLFVRFVRASRLSWDSIRVPDWLTQGYPKVWVHGSDLLSSGVQEWTVHAYQLLKDKGLEPFIETVVPVGEDAAGIKIRTGVMCQTGLVFITPHFVTNSDALFGLGILGARYLNERVLNQAARDASVSRTMSPDKNVQILPVIVDITQNKHDFSLRGWPKDHADWSEVVRQMVLPFEDLPVGYDNYNSTKTRLDDTVVNDVTRLVRGYSIPQYVDDAEVLRDPQRIKMRDNYHEQKQAADSLDRRLQLTQTKVDNARQGLNRAQERVEEERKKVEAAVLELREIDTDFMGAKMRCTKSHTALLKRYPNALKIKN